VPNVGLADNGVLQLVAAMEDRVAAAKTVANVASGMWNAAIGKDRRLRPTIAAERALCGAAAR
jgi:hypothetical protein